MSEARIDRRGQATEDMKARLRWMAEHPGEWLYWSPSPHSVTARGITAPSFERVAVSHDSVLHRYGPHKDWEPGLWVRYVGGGEANVTHTHRDVA